MIHSKPELQKGAVNDLVNNALKVLRDANENVIKAQKDAQQAKVNYEYWLRRSNAL